MGGKRVGHGKEIFPPEIPSPEILSPGIFAPDIFSLEILSLPEIPSRLPWIRTSTDPMSGR